MSKLNWNDIKWSALIHLNTFLRNKIFIEKLWRLFRSKTRAVYWQKTVDDVESLMKRQEDFESTLQAQDEKVKALDELADKLISDNHPDKDQ